MLLIKASLMCHTRKSLRIFAYVLSVLVVACSSPEFASVPSGDVDLTDFSKTTATADADGETIVRLTAKVPVESQRAPTLVTFRTDAGSFPSSSSQEVVSPVDGSGIAVAHLKAPTDPTVATIRAFAGQTTLVDSVRFLRTFPDTVLIDVAQFTVANNATVALSARLRRAIGSAPSKGTEVTFSASDSAGTAIGLFGVPSLSDASGTASVQFCPCRVPQYEGKVIIRATTRKKTGDAVSGTATILVTK